MKIGIISFEFPKLSKNGGIGTAYGRLAELMSSQGHEVTVFFVDIQQTFKNQTALLNSSLKIQRTIELKIISIDESKYRHHTWAIARSLTVYEKIKNDRFDVLHFHDCMGFSWAPSTAQKLGLGFQKTQIVLGMHGPNYWVNWAHNRNIQEPVQIQEYELEKFAFENADAIVSPSQYLLDFLDQHGWKPPVPPKVIPNCTDLVENSSELQKASLKIHEFIFFGRLEPRKGVQLFTSAIVNFLSQQKKLTGDFQVTYLGKDRPLNDGSSAKDYILKELNPFIQRGLQVQIYSDFDSKQCKEYFSSHPQALIVLPSLADNSPYAVVECLEQSLQFICSHVGGQRELLASDCWSTNTFAPRVADLCEMLNLHTTKKLPRPRPSSKLLESNRNWIQFHKSLGPKKSDLGSSLNFDVAIKASKNRADLEKTLINILSVKNIKNIFVYILESDFSKWVSRETDSLKKMLKKESAQIRVSIVFSGWQKEIFEDFLAHSKSDFCFFMNAGELFSEEGTEVIQILRPGKEDFLLFGYETPEASLFPPPVTFVNDLFYDSLSKFPTLVRREALNELFARDQEPISFNFSVSTQIVLRGLLNSKKISSVPVCLLQTYCRDHYFPYWVIDEEIFYERLQGLRKDLEPSFERKLKTIYHLKKYSPQRESLS